MLPRETVGNHKASSPYRAFCVVGGCIVAFVACTGQPPAGSPDAGAEPPTDGAVHSGDAAAGPDASTVPGPPPNRFGIGLVSPGDPGQWDLTAALAGRGGYIKLIFPGVDLDTTGAPADWQNAVTEVYARDLVPVIRLGPPWGDRNIRKLADDSTHTQFTALAARYAAVVAELPRRPGWPLIIEVHNEANLCYEWECEPQNAPPHADVAAGWIHYTDTATEYAYFLRDVVAAIRAIGDPRIKVINGGLAPGGAVACECGGSGFTAGVTSREFLTAMEAAVPGLFASLDGFASHAYPAQGEGWGFFASYENSGPGLHYFETELTTLGIDKPVYLTETGWTIDGAAGGNRDTVAQWTRSAWENVWISHPKLRAVMPFILQDGSWDAFAWADPSGNPYPVYDTIRDFRCSREIPEPCQ